MGDAGSRTGALLDRGWAPIELECSPESRGTGLVRELAASPFPALVIPTRFGGGGASLLELASAQREVARLDPSAAIALNMHSLSVGLMVDHWERNRDVAWLLLEGIAEQHALVASAFAERGATPNFLRVATRATPRGRGYVVTGVKQPCSLASLARLYCITAAVEGTDETIIALCPSNAPGIEVGDEWDAVGMRASDTRTVSLTDVVLDERLVYHRAAASTLDTLAVSGLQWFAVLMAATYHGVLTSLAQMLVAPIAARPPSPGPRRAEHARTAAGRALGALLALGALAQKVAEDQRAETASTRQVLAGAAALRSQTSRCVDDVLDACRLVLGGRMYDGTHPAARLGLDALGAHHHPPALCVVDDLLTGALVDDTLSLDIER